MKKTIYFLLALGVISPLIGQNKKNLKNEVIADVEKQKSELITISDTIWGAAEIAFQETVSSETLIAYAKANGFDVEVGVADTPTAFVATYGSGKPVIGILGEFDALPGISQKQYLKKPHCIPVRRGMVVDTTFLELQV